MKDFVLIDGFKIKVDVWEEIKDSYVSSQYYEEQIAIKMRDCIESVALSIENYLLEEDYEPQAASQITQDICDEFMNNPLIKAVINDEVRHETLFEIICGISHPKKELIVAAMLETAIYELIDLNNQLCH